MIDEQQLWQQAVDLLDRHAAQRYIPIQTPNRNVGERQEDVQRVSEEAGLSVSSPSAVISLE